MLDIVCMLFHIIRAYFPAEVRWSMLLPMFDNFAFISCMTTVLYCIWFTLRYERRGKIIWVVYVRVFLCVYVLCMFFV